MKTDVEYLARRSDGALLRKNTDGTYSFIRSRMNIPYTYTREQLPDSHFEEVTKKEFPRMKAKRDEYYAWLSWTSRPDGHGGSKGGTIEEYRALNVKPTKLSK